MTPTNSPHAKEESVSHTDIIVSEIVRRLEEGMLAPGQRIIASELAEEMGVSRVPVREALQRLAGQGVIDLDRNRSARVRPFRDEDIVNILLYLSSLAGLALKLAIRRKSGTPDGLKKLTAAFDDAIVAIKSRDIHHFNIAQSRIWTKALEVARNPVLSDAMNAYPTNYFNRAIAKRLPGDNWARLDKNYSRIHAAILRGDAHGATKAFNEHIDWAVELLENNT